MEYKDLSPAVQSEEQLRQLIQEKVVPEKQVSHQNVRLKTN